jgi:hypothetical protein
LLTLGVGVWIMRMTVLQCRATLEVTMNRLLRLVFVLSGLLIAALPLVVDAATTTDVLHTTPNPKSVTGTSDPFNSPAEWRLVACVKRTRNTAEPTDWPNDIKQFVFVSHSSDVCDLQVPLPHKAGIRIRCTQLVFPETLRIYFDTRIYLGANFRESQKTGFDQGDGFELTFIDQNDVFEERWETGPTDFTTHINDEVLYKAGSWQGAAHDWVSVASVGL